MKANIDIRGGEVLVGHVPPDDLRLLRRWLEPHREALEIAFYAALRHEATDTIITRYGEATREL